MKSKEALERVKTVYCSPTAYSSSNDSIGWFFEDIELIEKDLEQLKQYKHIEKELGIELLTLFNAFNNGVHFKRDVITPILFDDFIRGTEKQTIIGLDEEGLYFATRSPYRCYLKHYGITWALTREELENDK